MSSAVSLFSVDFRNRVQERILQLAAADKRVVAGAVVGSLALNEGDRWSDLDLTFSVHDGVPLAEVLKEWTLSLTDEFQAVQLFDLPSGPSIYRVFLLPGCLQFDLSFTPASQFGARGPKFKLLFGATGNAFPSQPPSPEELLGYAVHHALRARFCLERGKLWQAEYWISSCRDVALSLACSLRGLPVSDGRGFDALPPEVLDISHGSLITSLNRAELLTALSSAINLLLFVAGDHPEMKQLIKTSLQTLTSQVAP